MQSDLKLALRSMTHTRELLFTLFLRFKTARMPIKVSMKDPSASLLT